LNQMLHGERQSLVCSDTFLDPGEGRTRNGGATHQGLEKVAQMLRAHDPLLLNGFRAKGEISAGAVEGLNNKIRVITRRTYVSRTYEAMETALYHALGHLTEPESNHNIAEEAHVLRLTNTLHYRGPRIMFQQLEVLIWHAWKNAHAGMGIFAFSMTRNAGPGFGR